MTKVGKLQQQLEASKTRALEAQAAFAADLAQIESLQAAAMAAQNEAEAIQNAPAAPAAPAAAGNEGHSWELNALYYHEAALQSTGQDSQAGPAAPQTGTPDPEIQYDTMD
jgi:hypothetical protein